MIWLMVIGSGFLTWGSLTLLYKPFFDWKKKREKIKEEKYFVERYAYPGALFVAVGFIIFFVGLMGVLYPILPEPKELWVSAPLLICGAVFLISAALLCFSRKFNGRFWKYIWHYSDIKSETRWMCGAFVFIGISLLFAFYLFSNLFLAWPQL